MNEKEALEELARLFISYAQHEVDCDKFDDLPADETDTTERVCTCGLDIAKKEWQERYAQLDVLARVAPITRDTFWGMPFRAELSDNGEDNP